MNNRYVARPIVVEAHRWGGIDGALPMAFAQYARRHQVERGSWVIRGPDGVFSALSNGQFETAYAPAEAAGATEPASVGAASQPSSPSKARRGS